MEPLVAIVIGSDSDLPKIEESEMREILDKCGIPWELSIISAHRHPEKVQEYCQGLVLINIRAIIAGAGMAAHLAGAMASWTKIIPVIGVALSSTEFPNAMDALLAMARMPAGCPVAVAGIGKAGLQNAAILAAQIVASADDEIGKEAKANLLSYFAANKKQSQIGVKKSRPKEE